MINTIKLTKEQRRFFGQFIKQSEIALTNVELAGQMYDSAQKNLWDVIKKVFPDIPWGHDAKSVFDHPKDGDWTITYYEKD